MTTTRQIESGQLIDLHTQVVGVARSTREAVLVDQEPGRPPHRIDGLTIGAPLVTGTHPMTARSIPMETNSSISSPVP